MSVPGAIESHWRRVYAERDPHGVSWFEERPERSLELIGQAGLEAGDAIIDVGGGTSRLAPELVRLGFRDVTVLDISGPALEIGEAEAGDAAGSITYLEGDVLTTPLKRRFALWHDRAVLHFMVSDADREAYARALRKALRPGGFVVVLGFGPDGPEKCSGLPVRRASPADVQTTLGEGFEMVDSGLDNHTTPSGAEQQFMYALLRLRVEGG